MALIITKEGLRNNNGGQELPDEILVRFVPEGFRASINQKFKLYYTLQGNEYTYQDITVAFMKTETLPVYGENPEDPEGEPIQTGTQDVTSKVILPAMFTQELTPQYIGQLEATISPIYTAYIQALSAQTGQNIPETTFGKVAFAYHYMVQQYLLGVLGEGTTIQIRLDLM